MPLLRRISRVLQRHWLDRKHYARSSDWLMSVYNRVLIHAPGVPLPGRGRVREVRPARLAAPLHIRLASSDWYVMEEIFFDGEYEPVVKHLHDVRSIVDLGANVGMSVRLWRTLYPDARIVAVEPDPANFAMAQRNNADVNGTGAAPARVAFVQACVAARERDVYLDRSISEYAISMRDDDTTSSCVKVHALTLPQILDRAGFGDGPIDLLKVDIEGAEAEVFEDCRAWIGRVNNMVIEIHHPYTSAQLIEALRYNGSDLEICHDSSKGQLQVLYLARPGLQFQGA